MAMTLLKINYGQEGWIPGSPGGTTGGNAVNDAANLAMIRADMAIKDQLQRAIEDVRLWSNASLTPAGNDGTRYDLFTDSNGYMNTLSTLATYSGAIYDETNDYYRLQWLDATSVTEPSFETVATWTYSENETGSASVRVSTGAQDTGWKVKGTNSYKLVANHETETGGQSGTTTTRITQTGVNWSNISRFQCVIKYSLDCQVGSGSASASIIIKAGSTTVYTQATSGNSSLSAEYEIVDVDVAAITGVQDLVIEASGSASSSGSQHSHGRTTFYIDNIGEDTLYNSSSIIQTGTLMTATENITHVYATYKGTTPSNTTLTYDVSSDNGSTYTTGLSFNRVNKLTSTVGTQLVMKINLANSSTSATPTVSGFAVAVASAT
jgi:hypothetical protein